MRQYPFIYSQRDPAWATNELGTVAGATIGAYGCILTCHAMKAGYYGHEIKPNALNDIYIQKKLYLSGDLLSDADINAVFSDIQLIDTKVYTGPADLAYLKQLAQDPTLTVTIELDFDHNPNDGIQTHFVELHDFDGTNLTIFDPWYGTDDNFALHYGTDPATTIQKIAVYKGTPTAPGTYVDAKTFTELVAKSTANDSVCDTLGLSHDAGKDAEDAAIAKLKGDLSTAQTTVNTLNGQLPALKTENETLQGQVTTLTTENETLKNQIGQSGSYQGLYEQCEIDLKQSRQDTADTIATMNRQMAQYKNTSYQLVNTGTLWGELTKRVFHLK